MKESSHGIDAQSVASSHGSVLTVHSGHGRYEDAHLFSLEKLIDDAEAGDENAIKRLRRRRKYELKLVTKYNRTQIENRADDCWYLIDSRWLNRWYAFVRGGENAPPGPISSRDLLDEKNEPIPGLRAKIDYRGVAPLVFYVLCEFHGRDGSPEICRYEVDIYTRPLTTDRIIKVAHKAAVEARIQVSKLRPKWLKWEREYPEDEEDAALGCCCGLTREHLEAFIYWMVACWSRRSSGRGNISYRQYQPLRGKDDDPSRHGSERGSAHGESSEFVSQGPGRLSMEMSLHGSSRHSTNPQGSSQHGASRTSGSAHGLSSRDSQHGSKENAAGGDNDVEWVWSDVLNPLTRSFHGMSDRVSSHSSRSAPQSDDADGDDSDSDDSDDSADGFQVAPADVGHESGTWLRGF